MLSATAAILATIPPLKRPPSGPLTMYASGNHARNTATAPIADQCHGGRSSSLSSATSTFGNIGSRRFGASLDGLDVVVAPAIGRYFFVIASWACARACGLRLAAAACAAAL